MAPTTLNKEIKLKRFIQLLLLFSAGLGFGLGAHAAKSSSTETLLSKLTVLAEIFGAIQNHYIDTPPTDELIYGAARGILQSLDSHSIFFTPQAYKNLKQNTQGEHAGVGLELNFDVNPPEVIAVIENSPAAFAGIHTGDKVLKIANRPAKELSYHEAQTLLRGEVGSRLKLLIQRDTSEAPWNFTLIRNWVRAVPLEHQHIEDGIHYIKLRSFSRGLSYDLRVKLKSQTNLRGLILDLRNNPGGLFDEAVSVSDLFLNEGVIVSALGRHDKLLSHQQAHPESIGKDIPIAVLINHSSASASEIVAGALQDNNRARLFGLQTYGKGSVQTILELSDGSGAKITIARYRTPNGKIIDGAGIFPDVVVQDDAAPLDKALQWMHKKLP